MSNETNQGTPAGNTQQQSGSAPQSGSTPQPGRPESETAYQDNPRAQGNSPAIQSRQRQAGEATEAVVRLGENEFSESRVRSALTAQAEAEIRKQSLPPSPDGYQLKLPHDFQAPAGLKFEFDQNDPLLKTSRELAHKRGLDQESYSEFLGIFAANKLAEAQRDAVVKADNLKRLGSTGHARIDAVCTWIGAHGGPNAGDVVKMLRQYPAAPLVSHYEWLIRSASSQGGSDFSQRGREQIAQEAGKIAGFENMSFAQRRVAQMQQQGTVAQRGKGTER